MDLPPGFRFHPTDEELITHYLANKSADPNFTALAIGEVDMNKIEPWELPWKAKLGEQEWYFFCVRDKKYPTGLRTNRATPSGYWKATGKDKEIYRGSVLVGMKKTLVFYMGRAPKGQKSNWVCHEYRLEPAHQIPPKSSTNDWVMSRVFHKTSGGKKVPISGLGIATKMENPGNESSSLPPLMDPETNATHVHCFSSSTSIMPPTTTTMIQGNYYPDALGLGWGQFGPNGSILQNLIGVKDGDILSENSSVVSNEKKVGLEEDDNGGQHQDLVSIWSY